MLIGKGEFQTFPLIILCLTVPKQLVEEPFSVSLISCIKKKLMLKRVMSRYYNEMFFSHVPKTLVEQAFCVSQIVRFRKILDKRRWMGGKEYHNILSKNFV